MMPPLATLGEAINSLDGITRRIEFLIERSQDRRIRVRLVALKGRLSREADRLIVAKVKIVDKRRA